MTAVKVAGFGTGVNVTLGLPFPRVAPDHGTALDIAGKGVADPGSMRAALDRKSTRLNSSHSQISYAVFCLKKKKITALHAELLTTATFVILTIPLQGSAIDYARRHPVFHARHSKSPIGLMPELFRRSPRVP